MATSRFTVGEITARARQLADEQGSGWEALMDKERLARIQPNSASSGNWPP